MSIVILAEKPSQAKEYANAFSASNKQNGYYQVKDPLFTEETYITYGFGHLVELVPPSYYDSKWKKWSLQSLPIFPDTYTYQVPPDKKKQFTIVAKLLKQANTIIIATDCDREGENIAWSIIEHADAFSATKNFKRLWINSLEKEAIIDGFNNLQDGLTYRSLYKEAQTRQISDWLIGMNGSPLYTLCLQQKGISGTFSLGRVQTPTLHMIYKRQYEIEHFVKTPYLEIGATIKTDKEDTFKASLSPFKRFSTMVDLTSYLTEKKTSIGIQDGHISNIETTYKKMSSPRLFSLSSLQARINQLYKISPAETLKAAQSLYEAKLLTYPRTDSPYITTNEFNYLKNNLDNYQQFLKSSIEPTQLTPRKRYVSNKDVQEHHAIIPTKQVISLDRFNKLAPLQQHIYLLILKTTFAMFLPDYGFEETIIETKVQSLLFKTKGHVPKVMGWKTLFNTNETTNTKELMLPLVTIGQKVSVELSAIEKETQPPKAYTEGTLITMMKTAGKSVDNEEAQQLLKEIEGIGTEATRANIIETLKKKEYISIKKNKVTVTEKGKILCQAVETEPLLTSAEMTAKWETYLKKIGKNQGGTQDAFIANIQKFIQHLLVSVPTNMENLTFTPSQKIKDCRADYQYNSFPKTKPSNKMARATDKKSSTSLGHCPRCQHEVILKKDFYGCLNYPDCRYTLPSHYRNKKLTKANVRALLKKKETVITGIKTKDKVTYNARVSQNNNGVIEFIAFEAKK
ncbi:DNA topoisomerase III [Vagococcus intermedius]|uniref:DNA topoisomerase n=1 Tax=Vagococcus intermedius TaxID=2991418 RepID=A0AAF0CTZ0_9ENTE|nr:type IA DNA topoisomerase [Vagococcus intermedius]WEG72935.1 DNA topoisomerase III [Vagococcus intermedius]WEG75022.1 DNA topoisomerase III [Vagococcus intermedius]